MSIDETPFYKDESKYEIVMANFNYENSEFQVALLDYDESLELNHLEAFLDKQTLQTEECYVTGRDLKTITLNFYYQVKEKEVQINKVLLTYMENPDIIEDINKFFLSCFSEDIKSAESEGSIPSSTKQQVDYEHSPESAASETDSSDNDASSIKTTPVSAKRKSGSNFETPLSQIRKQIDSPLKTPTGTVKWERKISSIEMHDSFTTNKVNSVLGKKIILHLKRFKTPFKTVNIISPEPYSKGMLEQFLDPKQLTVVQEIAAAALIPKETEKELELRKFYVMMYFFESMKAGKKFKHESLKNLTILPDFMDTAFHIIGEVKLKNIFRLSSRYIKDWWNVMQLPMLLGDDGLGVLSDDELLLLFQISYGVCRVIPIKIDTSDGFFQFVYYLMKYKNSRLGL